MKRIFVVIGLFVVASLPSAAAAEESDGECDRSSGAGSALCEEKSAGEKLKEFITSPGRYVAGEAVESFTRWLAEGAAWLVGKVVGLIDQSTRPDLGANWFKERYRLMVGIGGLVLVPMLLMAAIRAVMKQDFAQLGRSFLLYLPIAILAMFVAVELTQAGLVVTDGLSELVSKSVGQDVVDFYDGIGQSLGTLGNDPSVPLFVVALGSIVAALGAFFIWIELLVRSAAIYVAVFFLPLTLAALVWPATMKWARRLVGTLAAIIASKFVIVSVISLATAALGAGSQAAADPADTGISTVLGAGVLLVIAAFSPFVLMKFMPLIEDAAIGHLEGAVKKPAQSVQHGTSNVYHRIFRDRMEAEKGRVAAAGASAAGASAGGVGLAAMAMSKVKDGASRVVAEPAKRMEGQILRAGPPKPPGANGIEIQDSRGT